MTHDYIATLNDLPARHRGVLLGQLHLAAVVPTYAMRGLGLCLPGQHVIPTQEQVFEHLCKLTNHALHSYLEVASGVASGKPANEIWGEEADEIFHVELTGLSKDDSDGYTIDVDLNVLNLLYR